MEPYLVKKVLIALDYNPTAQLIAETGFSIAKSMNAETTLLHVVSDLVYYSSVEYSPIMGFNGFLDPGLVRPDAIPDLKEAALQYLEKIRIHLGDPNLNTIVTEGDFAESIMRTATNINANIIVIGTHSRKWLENVITGSVTEYLLRHSRLPLFVVPTKKN